DGEEVGFAVQALQLSPDLLVTIGGGQVVVEGGGVRLVVDPQGRYLNITVDVDPGLPLRGLLGDHDGDPSNDLRTADGSRTYTQAELAQHDAELYDLAESWRITDPADSRFSRTSPNFAAAHPPFDWSLVEPYVAEVQAAFADLAPLCDGLDAGSSSYQVQMLALELYLGLPIGDVAGYSCEYRVGGQVAVPDAGARVLVPGAEVTVRGPGLTSCVAVTNKWGAYSCSLLPDLDALRAMDTPP